MKIFTLQRKQEIFVSIEEAWAFFSKPQNLSMITPRELDFKIKGDLGEKVYNGMIIEYTVKPLLGIEMLWVSEIKHVKEPYIFVDEQRVGPYKLWYHQHIFRPTDKGVEIIDIVHYALPAGFLAPIINKVIVSKQLDKIFSYRVDVIERLFGAKRWV